MMGHMRLPESAAAVLPEALKEDLRRAAFYPELVAASMAEELGERTVHAHLVHVDTHFDYDDLHRHITVLVLADGVLAAVHLTDFPADEFQNQVRAQVSTEIIPMAKIGSVVITTVYDSPQNYRPGDAVSEITLAVTWAGGYRVDLIPAVCPNPECEVDHGSTGTSTPEDLVLRIAGEAEGQTAVNKGLTFARALRAANLEYHAR